MKYEKKTLIKVTTVPESLLAFHKGHGNLLNDSFNVIAISSDGDDLKIFSSRENISTIPVKMNRRISVFADFFSIIRMYWIFRRIKPFIVHSMTPKAGLISMVAAFLAGVPHRIHTFTGLIFPTEKGFKRYVLINIDRLICFLATIILPEGQGVKKDLHRSRITSKNLRIIANGNFNGIDLEYFNKELYSPVRRKEIREKLAISESAFVFSFVGRVVRDKGIEELVNAFCRLSYDYTSIRLIIVGNFEKNEDPLSDNTLKLIKENAKIIHIPFQQDIRPFLAISDVFVFPSYREGFPNTVLEAGSMGLPCIVTNINGSNEIIHNGVNGLIINKKSINELTDALFYFYNNPSIRDNMAKVARRMISSRYNRSLVQQELLKMYLDLK